jgi:hypothetical protein
MFIPAPAVSDPIADDDGWEGSGDVVSGVVERISSGSVILAQAEGGPPIAVRTGTDTRFWKEAWVDLSAFEVGDEAVAVGRWDGEGFLAAFVTPAYRIVEDTVQARIGDLIEGLNGPWELVPETAPVEDPSVGLVAKSPADIGPGDRIFLGGRMDGQRGRLIVLRIGVFG